jgi:hypothetical protein
LPAEQRNRIEAAATLLDDQINTDDVREVL